MKPYVRVFIVTVALLCAGIGRASAQTPDSRFEVAGQISTLRLSDFDATIAGFGGRVTFDVTRLIAVEAEVSFFPNDDVSVVGSAPGLGITYERRRTEAFFGPKIGVRGQRFGVFGRAQPGFTTLTHEGVGCSGDVCALILLAVPVYRTEFALDLGGTLEFYPSRGTVARFDIGSTIIRHRSSAPPCFAGGCTSQNFSTSISAGVRF